MVRLACLPIALGVIHVSYILALVDGVKVTIAPAPGPRPHQYRAARTLEEGNVIRSDAIARNGTFIQQGITYTNGKYCPNVTFDSADAEQSLEHLASTGANYVAIVVTQYMDTINHTDIFPLWTPVTGPLHYYTFITASDTAVTTAIQRAHALGLKVMLKPHIDLINDPQNWRGDIGYYYNSTQWDQWFDSYAKFIGHYATIARDTGVEQISLSCELVTASAKADHWRRIAGQVRAIVQPGTMLTDAANWGYLNATGGEAYNKTWWDAVDIIGVDAYYPLLSNISQPSVPELVQAWQPVVERWRELSLRYNRPVIFTEIGFCTGNCSRGGERDPRIDTSNQANHYIAVFEAFRDQPWFHGIFWWTWNTDPAFGGDEDRCISPQYKPAELVLRQYYGASQPAPKKPSRRPVCPCIV